MRVENGIDLNLYQPYNKVLVSNYHNAENRRGKISFTAKPNCFKQVKPFLKTFFEYLTDPYGAILRRTKPVNINKLAKN